jgi:hypothetical protein
MSTISSLYTNSPFLIFGDPKRGNVNIVAEPNLEMQEEMKKVLSEPL